MSLSEPSDAFGPFRLLAQQRRLLAHDERVALGSRALDVLVALIERAGHVIPKRELMARVWPNMVVGEGSLKVAVSKLRRGLGDAPGARRYLANVPGRRGGCGRVNAGSPSTRRRGPLWVDAGFRG